MAQKAASKSSLFHLQQASLQRSGGSTPVTCRVSDFLCSVRRESLFAGASACAGTTSKSSRPPVHFSSSHFGTPDRAPRGFPRSYSTARHLLEWRVLETQQAASLPAGMTRGLPVLGRTVRKEHRSELRSHSTLQPGASPFLPAAGRMHAAADRRRRAGHQQRRRARRPRLADLLWF